MSSYLGQNFLTDSKYTSWIVEKIASYQEVFGIDQCREIGPGKGALTKKIHPLFKKFIVFEMDQTFRPILEPLVGKEQIVRGDVLQANISQIVDDFSMIPHQTAVIGNIPYYITSPILRKFFGEGMHLFPLGIFLIQKEVAEKIKFDADKKSFLRWILNNAYEVKYLKTVPAKAFTPAPKVDSAFIGCFRKSQAEITNIQALMLLLDAISGYKRKTLGKIWKILQKSEKEKTQSLTLGAFQYTLPEDLAGKRLEELGRKEMKRICGE